MPLGMLGKYERLDVLGHGASGIVYLAKDTLLGRQVALKEIAAQGDECERFLEEARVLDRLRHPNIVQVLGVDVIGGKVVIAMEYVRGRNLQDVLRETPGLPAADAVNIAAQVCDGLAYAHAQRTVHRDVKPANILVARDGTVKLVDFGLAEVLGTHSMAGGAGTYAYMAPEDFDAGESSDRRADIWAAGVILYEMLAGRRPFQVAKAKDPFAWKRAIAEDPVVPVSALRPDSPPGVDAILARALARDKTDRYQDAASMAADLRALDPTPAFGHASPFPNGEGPVAESYASPRANDTPQGLTMTGPSLRSGEGWPKAGVGSLLPGLPPVADIDGLLDVAPDHWPAARAALAGGALAQWLQDIGEVPLARVADQIAAEPGRSDDDRLRDFLYRAGLETTQVARRAYDDGERCARQGRVDDAARLLRRAARLDPSQPAHHQALARALRAQGDSVGAALALEEGLSHHPAQRTLTKERDDLAGAQVSLSATGVDFGVLRQGQSRSVRLTLRNAGTGTLQGRVVSTPGWVRVDPAAFTTRQRQPLTLTAETENVLEVPAAYHETVVLETSGGRQEIAVSASVLPARRGLGRIWYWYWPLLACCLLPSLAGAAAPSLSQRLVHHTHARHLWQPGLVASGLLCGALFTLAVAAGTTWLPRLLPLLFLAGDAWGAVSLIEHLTDWDNRYAAQALVQTSTPILAMLILLAAATYRNPQGWGNWRLWRWIVAAVGLLVSVALLHLG